MALVQIAALKDFRANALSTTQPGTAFQMGAPSTGQKMYSGFHLTSASLGTTARMLVGTIQSATASGFGSPATRATFSLSTAPGAEWGTPVSSLSTEHTWWRFLATLSTAASTAGAWRGLAWIGFR